MEILPVHRSYEHIPKGIKIRCLDLFDISFGEGEHLHSDDYYVFGYVESGSCEIQVDFNVVKVEAGEAIIVSPSQLHRIISIKDSKGFVMLIDCSLVSEEQSKNFITFTRKNSVVKPNQQIGAILTNLFSIFYNITSDNIELSNSFRLHIGQAIIEVFSVMLDDAHQQGSECRYTRHADTFFTLLARDIIYNRQPSYYARKMNITSVYLNEVIKKATGKSISLNIKEEITLRAKRLLVFTNMDVKEVAFILGFNDVAYFTRLFTKTAGCSPIQFRKNLK